MPKCRFCDHNNPAGIDRCQNCGSWIEQAIPSLPERPEPVPGSGEIAFQPNDFERQIISLVKHGQKIVAIKLYREQSGVGLAEAKNAVEALAAGQKLERRKPPEFDGIKPDSLEGQVLALLQAQQKIQAIKLYREQRAVGLKEAKDAVEALAREHGINTPAGCAITALLMVIVSTILSIGAWGLLK